MLLFYKLSLNLIDIALPYVMFKCFNARWVLVRLGAGREIHMLKFTFYLELTLHSQFKCTRNVSNVEKCCYDAPETYWDYMITRQLLGQAPDRILLNADNLDIFHRWVENWQKGFKDVQRKRRVTAVSAGTFRMLLYHLKRHVNKWDVTGRRNSHIDHDG